MNYHVVSTSNAGYGAIFTNKTEAQVYQNDHPGSLYCLFDRWPDRIPSRNSLAQDSRPVVGSDDLVGPLTVYTDGSCLGNPGPGGYGVVIEDANGATHELAQGYTRTTNQRMELLGVVAALETLPNDRSVTIASDSKYVIDGINKGWAKGWRVKGWKTSSRKRVANIDLWKRLLDLTDEFKDLSFKWVKGHAGNPLNERADSLAVDAGCGEHLIPDEGYRG